MYSVNLFNTTRIPTFTSTGNGGEVNRDTIKNVFDSIKVLGLQNTEVLLHLFQLHQHNTKDQKQGQQSTQKFFSDTLRELGLEDNQIDHINMTWLSKLNDEGVTKVIDLVSEFKAKQQDILDPFKRPTANYFFPNEVNIASLFDTFSWWTSHEIVAREGAIYLRPNHGDGELELLMSRREFFEMSKDKLNGLNLSGMDMRGWKLNGANFKGSNLYEVDFRSADLRDSNWEDTDHRRTDIRGANVSGVKGAITLMRAIFDSSTIFDDRNEIAMDHYRIAQKHHRTCDHLTHGESYLTGIDAISNDDLKLKTMVEFVNVIRDYTRFANQSVINSCLDILLNNDVYLKDRTITDFIVLRLLKRETIAANSSKLKIVDPTALRLLLGHIGKYIDENKRGMLKMNNFFVQLIATCTGHQDQKIKQTALDLYNYYLNLPELTKYKEHALDHVLEEDGNITDIQDDDLAFVFFKSNGKGEDNGLLLSRKNINDMLTMNPDHDWSLLYFMKDGKALARCDLNHNKIFRRFKLFQPAYNFLQKNAKLNRLFDVINLSYLNNNDPFRPPSYDYRADLLKVCNGHKLDKAYVGGDHPARLQEIFEPLFVKCEHAHEVKLTDDHLNAVYKAFQLEEATEEDKARYLFCLAVLFARLSSSSYFGSEFDSPHSLRLYALALINSASEVHPYLMSKERLYQFALELSGDVCSNSISNEMKKLANNDPRASKILAALTPPSM